MIKNKNNVVKLFSKKPSFYVDSEGFIYIILKNSMLKYSNYKLVKKPNDILYMVLLGKTGKTKFIFYKDIPELSLPQLHQLCKFLYKVDNKKFSYENFCEFLIKRNIVKKQIKNNKHIWPQNRYKTSDISYMAGITSKKTKFFVTDTGLKYIFNSSEINIKKYIQYFK